MAHKRVHEGVVVHANGARRVVEIETSKHDRVAARAGLALKVAEQGGVHGVLKRGNGREGRKVLPALK